MIQAFHMDDRLIHGQVAISWTRGVDANVILVINDKIVQDEMRKMALKLGVPPGVKYGFRTVEKGIEFLNGPEGKQYKIMALVDNPIDALAVAKAVPDIQRLSIGGVRKEGHYVYEHLNLDLAEVRALQEIIRLGKPVGYRPIPSEKFLDLGPYLDKAEAALSKQ